MDPLLKKLNYVLGTPIWVYNTPEDLLDLIENWKNYGPFWDASSDTKPEKIFLLAFVQDTASLENCLSQFKPYLQDDNTLWVAYPKQSSKKYKSEINRDHGWEAIGALGMEGVRQIAIDADWSALRFRHVQYIKSLTRKFKLLSDS